MSNQNPDTEGNNIPTPEAARQAAEESGSRAAPCALCSDLLAALKVAEEQLTKAEDELRGLGGDDGACEVGILACRMAISRANDQCPPAQP